MKNTLFGFACVASTLALMPAAWSGSPASGQSFVYAINGTAGDKSAVQNYFVDLFDASSSRIQSLKKKGANVICYFSAGSAENWRPDYKQFPKAAIGKKLDGWDGENWLDYRNSGVIAVMNSRISLAKSKGCDAIDPDNIDGHLNKSGFSLSARDQKDFIEELARLAHSKGLKIGLKNSAETAWDLQPLTDFAVIEECWKYNECNSYKSFNQNRKAMFMIEYTKASDSLCKKAKSAGGTLLFSDMDLTKFSFCK